MLMDACYDREAFPTIDQAVDWCWASSEEEISAVKFVLSKFFTEYDGVFKQSHITEMLDNYHKNRATNKTIAVKREADKRTKREQTVNDSITNEHLITNKELRIKNQELEITNQELKTKDNKIKPIVEKKLDVEAESQILDFLIRISGKNFKHVKSNLRLITARLKEGHTEAEILAVVEMKVKEWQAKPKMTMYIRPATIFGAEKFNQYVGELGVETPEDKNEREMQEWINEGLDEGITEGELYEH